MKRYSLTPAQSFGHVPEKPELTAVRRGRGIRPTGFDPDQFRVFPNITGLRMFLSGRAGDFNEWQAWTETPAGERWKQKQRQVAR